MHNRESIQSEGKVGEIEQVHSEFFFLGELIEFHGPSVSLEEVVLPDGAKIEPWTDLPTMVLLKYRGITVAGPCKKKVMYSFVFKYSSILKEVIE